MSFKDSFIFKDPKATFFLSIALAAGFVYCLVAPAISDSLEDPGHKAAFRDAATQTTQVSSAVPASAPARSSLAAGALNPTNAFKLTPAPN